MAKRTVTVSYRSTSTSPNVQRIERAGKDASQKGKEAAQGLRRAAEHLKRASETSPRG